MTGREKQTRLQDYLLTLYEPECLDDQWQATLRYFTLLPAADIPLPHLKPLFAIPPEQENEFEDHLDVLYEKGWLERKEALPAQNLPASYKMHPLMAELIAAKLKPDSAYCAGLVGTLSQLLRAHLTIAWDFLAYAENVCLSLKQNDGTVALLNLYLCDKYREIGNLPQALAAIKRAEAGFKENGDAHNLAITYERKGSIHQALGQFDKALQYFELRAQLGRELYEANPKSVDLVNGLAVSYYKLAVLRKEQACRQQVADLFREAIALWQDLYKRTKLQKYADYVRQAEELLVAL